jgi:hypothetical protein
MSPSHPHRTDQPRPDPHASGPGRLQPRPARLPAPLPPADHPPTRASTAPTRSTTPPPRSAQRSAGLWRSPVLGGRTAGLPRPSAGEVAGWFAASLGPAGRQGWRTGAPVWTPPSSASGWPRASTSAAATAPPVRVRPYLPVERGHRASTSRVVPGSGGRPRATAELRAEERSAGPDAPLPPTRIAPCVDQDRAARATRAAIRAARGAAGADDDQGRDIPDDAPSIRSPGDSADTGVEQAAPTPGTRDAESPGHDQSAASPDGSGVAAPSDPGSDEAGRAVPDAAGVNAEGVAVPDGADASDPHRPGQEGSAPDELGDFATPPPPPIEPPPGADALMWRLARRLFVDHRPDRDGFCVACREYWPCETHVAADMGLQQAVRQPPKGNPGGRYRPGP